MKDIKMLQLDFEILLNEAFGIGASNGFMLPNVNTYSFPNELKFRESIMRIVKNINERLKYQEDRQENLIKELAGITPDNY